MRPYKIAMLVVGILAVTVAFGLLALGAPLVWAHTTQRDAAGYYTTTTQQLASPTYAVVSEHIDLAGDARDGDWTRLVDRIGDLRISGQTVYRNKVFIGVARTDDVSRYLNAVPYDTLTGANRNGTTYRHHDGTGAPKVPAGQSLWVASVSGPGRQTLNWHIQPGDWTVVVMNAEADRGISVDAHAGLRTNALYRVGLPLLIGGLLLLAAGAIVMVLAVRGLTHIAHEAPAAEVPGDTAHPVRVDAALDPNLSRWLWLVKWLLAIPHFVILVFLWLAFGVLTFVAGIVVLATGRYPRGIFAFNVGVLRWQWRVSYYAVTLGTDRYPPFTLHAVPDYPATLSVDYPEQPLSRPLVLIKWWLLALPHYLVVGMFTGATWWGVTNGDSRIVFGGGLVGLLGVIAGVTLAVTRRYPPSVFDFILGMQRWTLRVAAYAALMRDEYPPFRIDIGGTDPGSQ
jgi:hypothetical protein